MDYQEPIPAELLSRQRKEKAMKTIAWILSAAALTAACILALILSPGAGERQFPVYISEIVASNTLYPDKTGRCSDYIELHNGADYPVDLSGFQLGDLAGKNRYVFPAGTVLEPGGYLVVGCDSKSGDPGYAPFGISRSGGETFCLIAANKAVVDRMVTLALDTDEAMALSAEGAWERMKPTPGGANLPAADGAVSVHNTSVSPVQITEISSAKSGYVREAGILCDWVELYNASDREVDLGGFSLSDNVGNEKYVFSDVTLAPGEYLVVYCDAGAGAPGIAPFSLSQQGGETVVLKDPQGLIADIVTTMSIEGGQSMSLQADGTWRCDGRMSPGYENTDAGSDAFLQSVGAQKGALHISEVMPAQKAFYPDCFGQFSDWVEICNCGDTAVNLAGWFLSDNPNQPQKWMFPEGSIAPGERLVVFCSGADTVCDGQLHTSFSLSSGGESLVLSSFLGTVVDAVSYGRSETNVSWIFDPEFAEPVQMLLPTPGFSNDQDGYEQFQNTLLPAGDLAIWEVMTSNDSLLPQQLGKCYDWVELRNLSNSEITLSQYALTDDPGDVTGFTLPDKTLKPGESITVILSGDASLSGNKYPHAPFSLNAGEDQLLLYTTDGTLRDFVYLKKIPYGMSVGRLPGTGGFFYMEPTPETDNVEGTRLISTEPVSTFAQGTHTGEEGYRVPFEAAGKIYYTTDGSEPNTESQIYSGPVEVTRTTVLRAISIEEGKLPSGIYTATFVVNEPHDLPVVSLVTDPGYLWGPDGIYRNGVQEVKEIKVPANVSYTGSDGSFSMDCEMNLHGATTVVAFNKKSFTIRFTDGCDGPLNYDVFEDGEVTTFRSLILRTAHESSYSTQMHDTFIASVALENCDTVIAQKYKYVALYLNGEYWGMYAIREHHSQEHYASYMNVPADDVEIVRYAEPAENSLKRLYDYCKGHSLKDPENYAYAESVMDMSSYMDWLILEAYMCNVDVNENMRYYYSPADGLWRCGLVDLDLGMSGNHDAFGEMSKNFHHSHFFNSFRVNDEFKDQLATRLAELLRGPMSDENMIARIDAMADTIRSEIPLEAKRWNSSVNGWETFIRDMKKFCTGRASLMARSLSQELAFTPEDMQHYFGDILK